MKRFLLAALSMTCLALPGCASIIDGTTQSVAVTTPPIVSAKCVLKSSEGTYYVTTPGNVTVHKTKNDMNIDCDNPGYQHASKLVASKFGATTALNVLAGGLIGLGIDAASGANYSYPKEVEIPMVPVLSEQKIDEKPSPETPSS